MEKGLNFRTEKGREDYYKAYEKTLGLWDVNYREKYIDTSFGKSHCLFCGNQNNSPIILLHAASCGATIWYPNVKELCKYYAVYAIDLITEASKSVLLTKIKTSEQCAQWLNETIDGLNLDKVFLCGLSIGGWNAANYAILYPERVKKLILLSPISTFNSMYKTFFFKIIKMGYNPTRESVEEYLGWGNAKEGKLPDSVIEQFTISAQNINSNGVYPKVIKKKKLLLLNMPVIALFGENEYSYDINKAISVAKSMIHNIVVDIIDDASHLISVSSSDIVNQKIINFLKYKQINNLS